ncbi:MAG: amino acid biosynthesis protein [Lactobacillus sp.]|jgi:subtilisin family serine protease|nr:amino acid biosynthesis protein [Lactobacillus sp.]
MMPSTSSTQAKPHMNHPKIHTLGPDTTDSSAAADYYLRHYDSRATIQLHGSYEAILNQLSDYDGDYLLMPTAFQSRQLQESWGDIHYCLLDHLELVTSYTTQLDDLILVENQGADNQVGYTHAATAKLLAQVLPGVVVRTAVSKYQAYQHYLKEQARYVLTNSKNLDLQANETILKTWRPKMVWCLYAIH